MKTALLVIALRVIDGDTLIVDIPNCQVPLVCSSIPARISNIDTPEKGSLAKCDYERLLSSLAAEKLKSLIHKGDVLILENVKRDRYFRLLGSLPTIEKEMMNSGLSVEYHGKKKTKDWCVNPGK